MSFRYPHPRPAVTVDACVFLRSGGELRVLLVRRGRSPFQDQWSLPGGFVEIDESLDAAVARELEEETGLAGVELRQLHAFGAVNRDPRDRVISIAYVGTVRGTEPGVRGGDDASLAEWFPVDQLPALAFDHDDIVRLALERIGG